MFDLPSLRRKYGSVFVTNLENGDVIPWKQLTIGEYLEYSLLLSGGVYAKATIEDEIFKKCVIDEYIIDSLEMLKAGTVSTVVQDIIDNSGPGSVQDLNTTLNAFRNVASQAIHQTAAFICQAFPAYKLEDVYEMDYGNFILRLAQAEAKLLQVGILQQPINFHDPDLPEEPMEEDKKPSPMDLYLEYQKQEQEAQSKDQTIITSMDSRNLESEMSGHEKEAEALQRNQMLKDAAEIYKDYLDQTSSGGKLIIKTPEERLAAANKRAELNKEQFEKNSKKIKLNQELLEKKYQKVFEAAVKKK